MGRGESPLDPDRGPVQRFAYDLRELRQRAGSPTYRTLASRTHYSLTSLSQATSGRALPSLSLTRAFVLACGEDPGPWQQRWYEVAKVSRPARPSGSDALPADALPTDAAPAHAAPADARTNGAASTRAAPRHGVPADALRHLRVKEADPQSGPTPPPGRSRPAGRRRARWRLGLTGAAALAAAALVLTVLGSPRAVSFCLTIMKPSPQQAPTPAVVDGEDPDRAGCASDAVTTARNPVQFPADQVVGTVELQYSAKCHAAWARFEPVEGWDPGPGTVVTVWATRAVDQAIQARSVTFAGQAIVSGMLLTVPGPVMGEAIVVRGGTASPITVTTTTPWHPADLRTQVGPLRQATSSGYPSDVVGAGLHRLETVRDCLERFGIAWRHVKGPAGDDQRRGDRHPHHDHGVAAAHAGRQFLALAA